MLKDHFVRAIHSIGADARCSYSSTTVVDEQIEHAP
jgi:hypothetical protein